MKTEILQMLRETADGSYISGQDLCSQLGVSRTAVWKAISQLRAQGYEIEAVQNRGYRLGAVPDILSESEIESWLQTKWLGRPVCYLDEVDSTNTQAKRIAEETGSEGHGTVVVAGRQTSGRGRRGRSWSSPHGTGIFFTILLKPDIEISNAPMLTLVKALAVAGGIRELTGLDAMIKWPNDIVVNGKKVVGILTELSAQIDYVNHIVVGTGINVHQAEFPEEIARTATSLDLELRREGREITVPRAKLLAAVLGQFEQYYETFLKTQDLSALADEYNSLLVNCGCEVRVLDPQGEYMGQAIGIDGRGQLLVERENGVVKISSGEVSVRGIYGYV
ncbi:biotin--[acetyl-CoA-carboxylase] ligase [Lachnospiraceae bacterium JLR.KK009]|jgi:BirA family biotin operon repressor/biotin-[acetyl-CoA-carboxylase] ligase|nr:biotin-[acetyl-CoA-carboxylase] ligase [Lachnospiraceae bacterium A2]MCI8707378.1 biotin--[acetyl-CoA-carboxylase] ligase [Lachnospiraceae bacterium]MCI8884129.1 biotin--[acetyl-CoA-carboxylase] ligase [Lachnospiraceae bacterium]